MNCSIRAKRKKAERENKAKTMDILNNLLGKKNKANEREILSVIPREIYEAGVLRLQDIIAPSALEITSRYVKMGEKVAPGLFLLCHPRVLGSNWFSPVINLDKVFDISIFIHPIDTTAVLRQLQKMEMSKTLSRFITGENQ